MLIKTVMNALEKYGAFATGFVCLISVVTSWGNNAVLTGILMAGAVVCPFIGISNIKESKAQNK